MSSTHMAKKEFNVCLMGAALDTGNMGVSALAASVIKLILTAQPEARIFLLIGNRRAGTEELRVLGRLVRVNIVNYRLSLRARLHEHLFWIVLLAFLYRMISLATLRKRLVRSNRWLSVLEQADFVGDIRGGDSFSDLYGRRRFLIGSLPCLTALLLHKKVVLLPQTFGPFKSKLSKFVARYIMSRCVRIFSRDRESCEVVEQILGNGKHRRRAEFCPDVAFMLDGVKPERLDLQPPLNGAVHGLLVGLNINGLVYHGGYTRNNMFALRCDYKLFVKQLVMRLLQDTAIRLLLVPHTFAPGGDVNSDTMACQEVLQTLPESLRSRVHLVARPYDQHEIKGIIGLCGFFIGSRMHACIAALSQSIPTVGVAYSRKFKGVFDVVGCKDMVVEARFVDTEAAVQIVCQHLQNRARTGKFLHERLIAAQKRISEVFQELLIQE